MQKDFWPNSEASFAATRQDALGRLGEFAKTASRYAKVRNFVVPGHANVSRLGPAIRHRLITETEAAKAVLERYAFSTVEKFLQEIYWRRYWKSWLSMRPQVWTEYLSELEELKGGEEWERAERVMNGDGSVAIMNEFSKELRETGYLHNHARMWFAGYWIHTLRLPWQLGADFFFRHLLDGDPASNTLSWRWVAGLQTPGKTYLARRSNIEKYLHPELLNGNEQGLDLLGNPVARDPGEVTRIPPVLKTDDSLQGDGAPVGLWLHEEDLSAGELMSESGIDQVLITGDEGSWNEHGFSGVKKAWLKTALDDAAQRCEGHFNGRVALEVSHDREGAVARWAYENGLKRIVAVRPEVGLVNDRFFSLRHMLEKEGVTLAFIEREEDRPIASLGKAGFFPFWKKASSLVRSL
ncbi:MAG: FAD-binding domain-containing protein [Akkermansiaceae bacterium]